MKNNSITYEDIQREILIKNSITEIVARDAETIHNVYKMLAKYAKENITSHFIVIDETCADNMCKIIDDVELINLQVAKAEDNILDMLCGKIIVIRTSELRVSDFEFIHKVYHGCPCKLIIMPAVYTDIYRGNIYETVSV